MCPLGSGPGRRCPTSSGRLGCPSASPSTGYLRQEGPGRVQGQGSVRGTGILQGRGRGRWVLISQLVSGKGRDTGRFITPSPHRLCIYSSHIILIGTLHLALTVYIIDRTESDRPTGSLCSLQRITSLLSVSSPSSLFRWSAARLLALTWAQCRHYVAVAAQVRWMASGTDYVLRHPQSACVFRAPGSSTGQAARPATPFPTRLLLDEASAT